MQMKNNILQSYVGPGGEHTDRWARGEDKNKKETITSLLRTLHYLQKGDGLRVRLKDGRWVEITGSGNHSIIMLPKGSCLVHQSLGEQGKAHQTLIYDVTDLEVVRDVMGAGTTGNILARTVSAIANATSGTATVQCERQGYWPQPSEDVK